MPLDYQTDTGPKLAVRFSMGEFNGRPNFLLASARGLLWNNLPPDLEALVKMPNMVTSIKNFALGPRGLYWYTYRSVNEVYEQKGSSHLWSTLNEDWKGGCPIRLSFGSGSYFWGEKEWVEPGKGHLVQAFGNQPASLIAESKRKYPGVKSFEIDFVTIGVQSAWVMGASNGEPCWQGINDKLSGTLKRETGAGHRVRNVVLCPCRADIYWIEYTDNTIDYFLPSDWDLVAIAKHFTTHENVPEIVFKPWDIPGPNHSTYTTLTQVKRSTAAWDFVVDHFRTGWRHPHKQPPPTIHEIWEIIMPGNLHKSFAKYLETIEKKHKFSTINGMKIGNQAYCWHGTRRKCLIGDDASRSSLCTNKQCATCCILSGSFSATYAGHAPDRNFLRFGRAIYTSAVSSKADDYTSSVGSQYKSLILARVVKGKSEKRQRGDKNLKAPTAGFDSVDGVVGTELNYEETCLYHNDAVRPAFMVLYK